MQILPTLHKRIRSSVLRVILLFGLLCALLIAGLHAAGRVPLELVRMNYDSIAYAQNMIRALNASRNPLLSGETPWDARFAQALEHERANLTEAKEKAIAETIADDWAAYQEQPDDARYAQVYASIDRLVALNEQGIFQRLEKSQTIQTIVVAIALPVFLLGVFWAFILADRMAARLAHPLRRVAELFRERPSLRDRLKLPPPQTLEVRILFDEIARMWDRLGEIDALNVRKLVEEKRKLEVILESIEDALCVLSARGEIVLVSRRMLALLGLPQERVLGLPWTDLPSTGPNYLALRSALAADLQGTREAILDVEHEERLYAVRRRTMQDESGRETGQVFLLRDVTEKRKRDTLRSEMMDWISHELKTPIQSLGLAAALLSRREENDPDMRMLVDTVAQDAERLQTLSRQFMGIARMSPFVLRLAPETLELGAAVEEWLLSFRLLARESGKELRFERPGAPIPISADRERCAWALSNLLSNALHSEEGSYVKVTIQIENGQAELRVEDDGLGVSADLEAHLFKPFIHERAGKGSGFSGLGLSITREIIEAHGGTIRYARRPEGGAAFVVRLPLSKGANHES